MVAFFIISGIVVLETSYTLFSKPTKINPEKHTRINTNFDEVRQKKDSSLSPSLSVSGWSKIFFMIAAVSMIIGFPLLELLNLIMGERQSLMMKYFE